MPRRGNVDLLCDSLCKPTLSGMRGRSAAAGARTPLQLRASSLALRPRVRIERCRSFSLCAVCLVFALAALGKGSK